MPHQTVCVLSVMVQWWSMPSAASCMHHVQHPRVPLVTTHAEACHKANFQARRPIPPAYTRTRFVHKA